MTKFIEGDGKKIPDRWQFISDENDIETIFKKLDWIAYCLKRLIITHGEGLYGYELDMYDKIFKDGLKDSRHQAIPKE